MFKKNVEKSGNANSNVYFIFNRNDVKRRWSLRHRKHRSCHHKDRATSNCVNLKKAPSLHNSVQIKYGSRC
jgi:hypothetical protein